MGSVKVSVLLVQKYDPMFPNDLTISALHIWLDEMLKKVPEEFRDKARVSFEGSNVDTSDASIEIYYNRPKTDLEIKFADEQAMRVRRNREAFLRQELTLLERENAKALSIEMAEVDAAFAKDAKP